MCYKSVILGRRWGADGTPNAADGPPNAALTGLKDRDGLSWDRGGAVEGRACAPGLTAQVVADVPAAPPTTEVVDDVAVVTAIAPRTPPVATPTPPLPSPTPSQPHAPTHALQPARPQPAREPVLSVPANLVSNRKHALDK
jgi:hypothetical protein